MLQAEPSTVVEMHCMQVRRMLVDYMDGDLDLEIFVRVDAHLGNCAHCKAIFDGVRNVVALLGSDDSFEVPAGLGDRFYDRLMESPG